MITAEQYFYGWVIYLVASLGLLFVWWYMTHRIPFKLLRNSLRLVAAAALLIPYPVEFGSSYLAPALVMSLLELLFVADGDFFRAGQPLITGIVAWLVLYFLLEFLWWKFWVNRHTHRDQAAEGITEDTMEDFMEDTAPSDDFDTSPSTR